MDLGQSKCVLHRLKKSLKYLNLTAAMFPVNVTKSEALNLYTLSRLQNSQYFGKYIADYIYQMRRLIPLSCLCKVWTFSNFFLFKKSQLTYLVTFGGTLPPLP